MAGPVGVQRHVRRRRVVHPDQWTPQRERRMEKLADAEADFVASVEAARKEGDAQIMAELLRDALKRYDRANRIIFEQSGRRKRLGR